MEEFNIEGKQTSFYEYCPGTFGYTLVFITEFCPTGIIKCAHKIYTKDIYPPLQKF